MVQVFASRPNSDRRIVCLQYPLFTILVYDAQGNGLPVAWYVTGSANADSIQDFLDAFMTACRKRREDFKPTCILMDDDAAEQLAVRYVVQ